jgi:hypothetical protein
MARPSLYESKVQPHLDEIKKMIANGMTEEQVSNAMGVNYRTFNRYKKSYAELCQALKKGKQDLVYDVEESLYRKARGFFTTKKITRKYMEDKQGNKVGGAEVTETITEHAPDLGSIVFTLKNLSPDKWKERIEHSIDGNKEMSDAVRNFLGAK